MKDLLRNKNKYMKSIFQQHQSTISPSFEELGGGYRDKFLNLEARSWCEYDFNLDE